MLIGRYCVLVSDIQENKILSLSDKKLAVPNSHRKITKVIRGSGVTLHNRVSRNWANKLFRVAHSNTKVQSNQNIV